MNAQLGRVVAPIVVGVFATVALLSTDSSATRLLACLVVVTLAVVVATFRAAGWVLIGGLALAAAGFAVLCHAQPANLGWFGLCVLVGWAALVDDLPRAAVLTAVTLVLLALEMVNKPAEPGWISWAAGCLFTFVACYFTRRQALLLQQLRDAQSALAEQARLGERARIAGELHDVVGHSMTVALMHIESARLALDDSRDEAQAALNEAERVTRRGLDEVRAAVGVMRSGDQNAAGPQAEVAAAASRPAAAPAGHFGVRGQGATGLGGVPARPAAGRHRSWRAGAGLASRRCRPVLHRRGGPGCPGQHQGARLLPDRAGSADQRRPARRRGTGRTRRPD